jgi:hypothetical protein
MPIKSLTLLSISPFIPLQIVPPGRWNLSPEPAALPPSFVDYNTVGEPALLFLLLNLFPLSGAHSDTLPLLNPAEKQRMRHRPNHPNTAPPLVAVLLRYWTNSSSLIKHPSSPSSSPRRHWLNHRGEPQEHLCHSIPSLRRRDQTIPATPWNPRWRGIISSLLSHLNPTATFCSNTESVWCNLSPTI